MRKRSRMALRAAWAMGLALAGFASAGCGGGSQGKPHERVAGAAHDTAAQAHDRHWGYVESAETVGPEHWGTISGDELCAQGREQSPIALFTTSDSSAAPQDLPNLVFHYQRSQLQLTNNGHTIQIAADSGSTLRIGADEFRLAQFHFHSPSEHTLDGRSYPMEAHFVHVDAEGHPAVVAGVLIRVGKPNAALAEAFAHLPAHAGETSDLPGALIDQAQVLPTRKVYISYAGSLTTPPCSEGIRWCVLTTPIEMSKEQIHAFTSLPGFAHINRPIQPRAGRPVAIDSTP